VVTRSYRRCCALGVAALLALAACGDDGVARISQDPDGSPPTTAKVKAGDVEKAVNATYAMLEGGGTGSLASYRGRPVVVNFFGSYCVPCITEMPDIEKLHQQYGDSVAFVGFAVHDRASAAKDLVHRTGVTYDIGTDPKDKLIKAFGGLAMPTTVLLRPDGTLADTHVGAITAADLATKIRKEFGLT
jgi:thiol-disulfide isomerase/thioredoxin